MAIPISDKSDEYLMDEIAQGNQASFRVLVMRYLQPGFAFVQRTLDDSMRAEKIVQKVFLTIWQEAPRWEPTTRFKTWFYRMIIKQCSLFAFGKNEHDTEGSNKNVSAFSLFEDEKTHDLKTALHSLSKKERTTLILYYYQGYTPIQIARILDTTVHAVETLLFRARTKLHDKLNRLVLNTRRKHHEHR